MKQPLFSILMCTKNSAATLRNAICSVRQQNIRDWELLILDNGSTDESWSLIQQFMQEDTRIHGTRLTQNVGWAKGAALCLKKAEGEYMTFLAADDFFVDEDCLEQVKIQIEKEDPDIVWVGHVEAVLDQGRYSAQAIRNPEYRIYSSAGDASVDKSPDKITEIYELMRDLYYNSFFHFEKITFLKQQGINFYEPYYADYEGMTRAMCASSKAVVLHKCVYALTVNTSQTREVSGWRDDSIQWKMIQSAMINSGRYDRDNLSYIAARLLQRNVDAISIISAGGRLRDLKMNELKKTALERFTFIEEQLEAKEENLMLYYAQQYDYMSKLILCAKDAYERCLMEGDSIEEIHDKIHWLCYYVEALFSRNGDCLVERQTYDCGCFEAFYQAMRSENNPYGFGFELLGRMIEHLDQNSEEICQKILKQYAECQCRIIEELLGIAVEITHADLSRNRESEIVVIREECMEILSAVQPNMTEEQLKNVMGRITSITSLK